jgi:3-methyladenine DNA glycosylase AlkD
MMNAQTQTEQFLKVLKKNADEEYRQGNEMAVPSGLKNIGGRVPVLRKIAKDWLKKNKDIGDDDWLDLVQALWQQPIFEMRSLTLELLMANKNYLKNFDWKRGELWLKDINNWSHCDFLSTQIFGFLVLKKKSHLPKLKSYLKKKGKWFRRSAIVSLIQLIRQKEIKGGVVLKMIDQIADDKDPMIQKAISWVLREMVRAGARKEVEKYVNQNRNRLTGYVVREVTNKLQTGLKSGKIKKETTSSGGVF